MKCTLILSVAASLFATTISQTLAQVPQYTPDEALSLLDKAIRSTLNFKEPGVNGQSTWLSLSYVGLEVPADDDRLIDLMAVQCPAATNNLTTFSTPKRLDQVYELILNNAALSKPLVTIPGLDQARNTIVAADGTPTPHFTAFKVHRKAYLDDSEIFAQAKRANPNDPQLISLNRKIHEDVEEWETFGHKTEIEAALDKVSAADANGSMLNTKWRREILTYHRNLADGLQQGAFTNASNAVPRSSLHPSPAKWASNIGWTKVAYEKNDNFSQTEDKYRKTTGYASGGGGFLFWKSQSRVGGSSVTETHSAVKSASSLKYTFEIRRAIIDRPWLDQRFLFEPGFWTWLRPANAKPNDQLPRISLGAVDNLPQDVSASQYIDTPIGIPLVPSEVIAARNLSVTATVSNSDYHKLEQQTHAEASTSGTAFFFFKLNGSVGHTAKLTNVTESGGNTTFTLSFEGPIVIGFISNLVPISPAPKNDGRIWPAEAWGAN